MSKQAKSSFKVGRGKGKTLLGVFDPDVFDPDVFLALTGDTQAKSDYKVGRTKSNYKVGQTKAMVST